MMINIDAEKIIGGMIASLLAGVGVLVRRVLTNEKKIALLEAHLQRNREERQHDREDLKELKRDVKCLLGQQRNG